MLSDFQKKTSTMSTNWTKISTENKAGVIHEVWKNGAGMLVQVRQTSDGVRRLYTKKGLPVVAEPEVNEAQLDEDYLNRVFLENRRICTFCGSKDNIGLAACVRPAHITEEERQKQSDEQKAINASKSAATAASTPSSEAGATTTVTDTVPEFFEPYAKNAEPTESVPDLSTMKGIRLVVDLVPCYICVNCRRAGECGTATEKNGGYHTAFPGLNVRIPSAKDRNIVNKYCQRNAFTIRFRGEDGEYHPITDRLVIFRSDKEAVECEQNLFQQLALFADPTEYGTLERMKRDRHPEFQKTLAAYTRQVIPTLLRAAAKLMVKGGRTECREMQSFEPTYEYSLIAIRAMLHIVHNYPETRQHLIRSVYQWAYNPFSKDAKNLFQHWMDPLWVATLCGIPFSHIREPMTIYLFSIMASRYCPDDNKMEKLDTKTYLKRVFNEGQSNNACREFLYALAFSGMIQKEIAGRGFGGLIGLMNQHSCYLPQDRLIEVWREMSYINDNITSLYPCDDKPGLFRHVGMGDKNADADQTVGHVFKFLNYARQFGLKMHDLPIPTAVINKICETNFVLSTTITTSAVQRGRDLAADEQARRDRLFQSHQGMAPLDPVKGAHRLTEMRCAYPECGRVFTSGGRLKAHLAEAWRQSADDPGFSLNELHRRACGQWSSMDDYWRDGHLNTYLLRKDMSPDLIMKEGLTQCPVKCCPEVGKPMTPMELCTHFAQRGVTPFWYPGWMPPQAPVEEKKDEETAEQKKDKEKERTLASIFDNPGVCIVCQDEPCSQILILCGHLNMCGGCKDKWCSDKDTCPTCRTKITGSVAMAAFMSSPEKNMAVYAAGATD